jgi:hypothetical protein
MAPDETDALTAQETEDLLEVLDDEYHAHATYTQILDDFGDVLPFANIRDAEARHIEALLALLRNHGVPVPPNTWPGRVPRYSSVQEACTAGVSAEIDNAAMYDRVLARTTRPDLAAVYQNLQRASRENHLPAFQRCAEGRAGTTDATQPRRRRFRGGRS